MLIFVRLRSHFQQRIPEWFMSAVAFTFGWFLLAQPGQFDVNPIFSEIRHWVDQPALGLITLLGFGAARMLLLVINGAWRPSPWLRAIVAICSAFFWMDIVFGLSHSGRQPISIGVYLWFIPLEVRTVYCAVKDARDMADATITARLAATKASTDKGEVVPLRA